MISWREVAGPETSGGLTIRCRAQRGRGSIRNRGIVCPSGIGGPIGLGIAPGGDDRAALHLISNAIWRGCRVAK